ncbi:MAG: zinc-ribbon domain-containing protein [Desulfobulbaceae bacterium]|nr:zinc-ribbon domain-containing protein [Desulfobulbaceae bacterium]
MRFKCGQCGTNYSYDAGKITGNGVILRCKSCDNKFAINKNHVIKARDANSLRYCSNCNNTSPISANSCDKCGFHFNIGKISLIIDNKDYVSIEEETRSLPRAISFFKRNRKSLSLTGTAMILVTLGILFIPFSSLTTFKDAALEFVGKQIPNSPGSAPPKPNTMRVQGKFLISLADGGEINADTINFREQDVQIIDTSGMEITISKKNITGIANIDPSR